MKLLQLNMWMGRLTRQIIPFVEREQPDIITAQEVFSSGGIVGLPDNTFHLLDILRTKGGYEFSYFSPTSEEQYAGVTVGCGNAILSKLPLSEEETFFTSGVFNAHNREGVFESNVRNAQIVLATLPNGRKMYIVNHHGYWEPTPDGSAASVAAMQIVADRIKDLDGPIVFAGDLNVNPHTATMRLFDGVLEDLLVTHGVTNTISQLGKVQGIACDHVLVNNRVQVHNLRVLDDLVSDHKAVVLEFEI